jgi:mRNA interferase MazF
MNRGEVWWVNFEPSIGGEIRKRRPAIIVSNDASNKYLNRVQVVPLSSQTEKIFPSEAKVTLRGRVSKAMADQVTTVGKARLISRAGRISRSDLLLVEKALRIQLGLDDPERA